LAREVGSNMMKISAIIPAKNEEKMISDAIKSLSWCDEIIVINDGSTDNTVKISKELGAVVVECEQNGIDFSKPRNMGRDVAKGEWLLYVDSDERVTEVLKGEIENVISNSTLSAYSLPRRNNFLGHDMKYGGWWPDRVMRLIRKESLIKWEGKLHEQPKIKGETGELAKPLYHITHRSLSEMIEKTNKWSLVEAKLLFNAGHPPMTWWRFLSAGFREFWSRGVRKLGFLDGPVGVIEIFFQTFSRMITYAKLWELQMEEKGK
jgi:glycosyltransferase involved in cell wall biosynthesis